MDDILAPSAPQRSRAPICPSADDPLIRSGCEVLGGPVGERAQLGRGWWTPVRVLIVLTAIGFIIGYLQKLPCIQSGWGAARYLDMCYSDIPPLFSGRGFADGIFPYLGNPLPGQEGLEYPVLTGLFMELASRLTPHDQADSTLWFFNINAVMLFVCSGVTVLATALTVRRRPWDAAMVALAPGLILCATINWDLLAVALLAVGMLAWSRSMPVASGVFIGLAAAAKFYPFLVLVPLALLCLRAGRFSAFFKCLCGAIVAWLAVNVPFMLANFDGWYHFYAFSKTRGEDFGSVWLALTDIGHHVRPERLNTYATGLFVVGAIGLAAVILFGRRRPRFAPTCFLIIAAFVLPNKVYSPQYVLWLIPLAVLARPRWRDFLIWQACEVVYYAAIWLRLADVGDGKIFDGGWYSLAIAIHVAGTGWLAAMILCDMLWPAHDPVRNDGAPEDVDDPGGGVLDGSPDVVTLSRLSRSAALR